MSLNADLSALRFRASDAAAAAAAAADADETTRRHFSPSRRIWEKGMRKTEIGKKKRVTDIFCYIGC